MCYPLAQDMATVWPGKGLDLLAIFAISVAVALWVYHLANKSILFWCDNLVVHIINAQASKSPMVLRLVCHSVLHCLQCDFDSPHPTPSRTFLVCVITRQILFLVSSTKSLGAGPKGHNLSKSDASATLEPECLEMVTIVQLSLADSSGPQMPGTCGLFTSFARTIVEGHLEACRVQLNFAFLCTLAPDQHVHSYNF